MTFENIHLLRKFIHKKRLNNDEIIKFKNTLQNNCWCFRKLEFAVL